MKTIYDKHAIITESTKQAIGFMKVVFPVDYGKLYRKFADELNIELAPHELLSHEMLDEKVVRHVISLSQYTQAAIEAMQEHNESKLKSILEETQKLRQEVEELQKIVYHDTLTQCYNRKWFEDHCLDDIHEFFSQNGTLVIVDLNRFKRINDEYGHSVGDRVLVHISKKTKELTNSVVRYGGDEFLLLFDGTIAQESIEQMMTKLFNEFEKATFKIGAIEFKISFAYGICPYTNKSKFIDVLDIADSAMYHYKKGRRA
jgi:diguanylate cyclase (GGDEF)-like protein